MRSWSGLAVLFLAACSSQPRTPAEEEVAVTNVPAIPVQTGLGDAYAAYVAEPRSAEKQRAYFDSFPNDYASLRKEFGFEEISEDSVNFGEYYEQGNEMIEAFFKLDSVPLEGIAAKAISITRNSIWQVDGVNYFQHFLAQHFEKAPAVYLEILNSMARSDQAGFWKLYVDGPEAYPKEDKSRLRGLLVSEPSQLAVLDSVLALQHPGH